MWIKKVAISESERIQNNIERLKNLRSYVHDLAYAGVSTNSGGFLALKKLLDDRLVLGREKVHQKLNEALIGENNSKIALDAPQRFKNILIEAASLIDREIGNEAKSLKELTG